MPESALLREISEIRIGYLARQSLVASEGASRLLQLRDVSQAGRINYEAALRPDLDWKSLGQFEVRDGDVLLSTRGEPLKVALVEESPTAVYASAHFFIVRPRVAQVTAKFLVWFFGHAGAQAYFRKHAMGTSIKMLSKKALEELPIPLPDLHTQTKIAKLNELNRRHRELSALLQEKLDYVVTHLDVREARGT